VSALKQGRAAKFGWILGCWTVLLLGGLRIEAQTPADSNVLFERWANSKWDDSTRLQSLQQGIEHYHLYNGSVQIDSLLQVFRRESLLRNRADFYAEALSLIGIDLIGHGDLQAAESYLLRAMYMNRRMGNHRGLGSVWNNLAVLYQYQDRTEFCQSALFQSMQSTARIADRDGFIHARVTLAEILALQGYTLLSEQILRSILEVNTRPISPEIAAPGYLYLGNLLVDQNRPQEALDAYLKSLEISERENYRQQEAILWSNISLIHIEMKNWASAEEAALRAIELNQQLNDTFDLFSSWVNYSNVLVAKGDSFNGLAALRTALSLPEYDHQKDQRIRAGLGRIRIWLSQNELDSARIAFEQMHTSSQIAEGSEVYGYALIVRSVLERKRGDAPSGLSSAEMAKRIYQKLGNKRMELDARLERYRCLREMGKADEALAELEAYNQLNGQLLAEENRLEVYGNTLKYSYDKKALSDSLEIKAIEERRRSEKRLQSQRQIGLSGLLLGALAFVGVVWIQRNKIRIERNKSDALLANILPEEVARELKEKGRSEARFFEGACVLFTDFSGFTEWSAQREASEVVAAVNRCFRMFDALMDRHGMEKIKTIGDSYMAVSGLGRDPNARDNAAAAVRTALDMIEGFAEFKAQEQKEGRTYFGLRIGLHSGPVVAGIVGDKKFQYDLWGDTVNTASRMEQSAEIGTLATSEAVFALLHGDPEWRFTALEPLEVKGKGRMTTYRVTRG